MAQKDQRHIQNEDIKIQYCHFLNRTRSSQHTSRKIWYNSVQLLAHLSWKLKDMVEQICSLRKLGYLYSRVMSVPEYIKSSLLSMLEIWTYISLTINDQSCTKANMTWAFFKTNLKPKVWKTMKAPADQMFFIMFTHWYIHMCPMFLSTNHGYLLGFWFHCLAVWIAPDCDRWKKWFPLNFESMQSWRPLCFIFKAHSTKIVQNMIEMTCL